MATSTDESGSRSRVSPLGIGLLLAVAAALALGWALRGGDDGDTLARIREEGIVRIGFANEEPYGYLDTATGRVTGEAPEIARVIFERMGIDRVETVQSEFAELIPALKEAKAIDVVGAGMYITPERCEAIDFSNPTYRIGEAFLVPEGNPKNLLSYRDVANHEDAKLGVMTGAVERGYALKLGVPEERIVVFPDYPTALVGLKGGRVDAIGLTMLTANTLLTKPNAAGLEKAEPFEQPVIDGKTVYGYGAFGFRPEDDALREEFNRHLAEFLGTPEHLALVKPFGFSEETLPGEVTAEQLCRAE